MMSCNKQSFPLKAWAVAQAQRMKQRTYVYWCAEHAAWHLTRSSHWQGLRNELANGEVSG